MRASVDRLRSDFVHTWRAVRARPAATAGTVLVLAVGIGLTTAMFALADPFVLRPLPYGNPEELVLIELQPGRHLVSAPPASRLSHWQARDDLFLAVAAYRLGPVLRLRTPAGGAALQSVEVSDNLPAVLQLPREQWMAGGAARESGELLVVLTAAARDRLFGAGSVVGQALPLHAGGTVRFVAMLPREFLFPRARVAPRVDALTLVRDPALLDVETSSGGQGFSASPFTVIARLRDGVTAQSARAALSASLSESPGLQVRVQTLTSHMRRGIEPLALGSLAAAVLVLLTCAGNAGNLLLARGVFRAREFATRAAIGATRYDVGRLIAVELAVTATGGIGFGLALTHLTLGLTATVIPDQYAALGAPAVNGRVIVFACLTGALVMIAGAIPAWAAWRMAPRLLLARISVAEGPAIRALRFALAAGQTALAVVLLSAGALLVRSYVNLTSQDTGFAEGLYVVSVSYPPTQNGARLQADIDATIERLRRLPAVAAVAAATGPMVDQLRSGQLVRVKGHAELVERKYVSPGYFEAVGTGVIEGRGVSGEDGENTAVVNEAFARRHWPDGGAVGQQMMLGSRVAEIVGVVRDTFDVALDTPPSPTVITRLNNPAIALRVNYAVRFPKRNRPADALLAREVAAVNPDSLVIETSPLSGRLAATVRDRSFATLVLTFFALAGIGVCAAGLIAIVSFIIARRTREIAIRMALGATPARIRRLVIREPVGAAAAGALAGMLAGRWLSWSLEGHLYGVQAGDWPTIVIAVVLMMLLVTAAAALPAVRAVRLSPGAALRAE